MKQEPLYMKDFDSSKKLDNFIKPNKCKNKQLKQQKKNKKKTKKNKKITKKTN